MPALDEPVETVVSALTDPCSFEGYPRDQADLAQHQQTRISTRWNDPRVDDEVIFGAALFATYRVNVDIDQIGNGSAITTSRTRLTVFKKVVLQQGGDICLTSQGVDYPCVPFYEWALISCDTADGDGGSPYSATVFNSMGFNWGGGASNMHCTISQLPTEFEYDDVDSVVTSVYVYGFRGTVDPRWLGEFNGTALPGSGCNRLRDAGPIPHYVWSGPGQEEVLYAGLEVYNDHYSTQNTVGENIWVTDPEKLKIDGEIEYHGP